MEKKPLIGLTPSHNLENDEIRMGPAYLNALRAAGAIPVLLPLEYSGEDLHRLAETLDGFLFTGGPDVHPFYFGEETVPGCGAVSDKRDRMELTLLPIVMEQRKPLLGICRGIQVMNIALGGNIWQDLPSRLKGDPTIAHCQPFDYSLPCHSVKLAAKSRLAKICGTDMLKVNSMHHQAVKDTAPGLFACGVSADHVTEAVEMPEYPFLIGVQWHPERLWEKDPAAASLFAAFADACRRG